MNGHRWPTENLCPHGKPLCLHCLAEKDQDQDELLQRCQSLAAHSVLDEQELDLIKEDNKRLRKLVREIGTDLARTCPTAEILSRPEVREIMGEENWFKMPLTKWVDIPEGE